MSRAAPGPVGGFGLSAYADRARSPSFGALLNAEEASPQVTPVVPDAGPAVPAVAPEISGDPPDAPPRDAPPSRPWLVAAAGPVVTPGCLWTNRPASEGVYMRLAAGRHLIPGQAPGPRVPLPETCP